MSIPVTLAALKKPFPFERGEGPSIQCAKPKKGDVILPFDFSLFRFMGILFKPRQSAVHPELNETGPILPISPIFHLSEGGRTERTSTIS